MKLKIIDNRKSIVDRLVKDGYDAIWGDYFAEAVKIPRHILVSSSNPQFTFGGGIDKLLYENFPFYCETKRSRFNSQNERIGNVIFTISVDNSLDANDELVHNALKFAIDNTAEGETLCLTAIGTGIGMLNEARFVEILKSIPLDK